MDQDKLCDDLLNVLDLSSIFEQIEADKKMITNKTASLKSDNSVKPFKDLSMQNLMQFNSHKERSNKKDKKLGERINAIFGHIPITSIDFIGKIKRTVPYSEEALKTFPVRALKIKMDELGVTEAMPAVYAARMKRFVDMGLVEASGQKFTEEGRKVAVKHLVKNGMTPEQAQERALAARSLTLSSQRAAINSTAIERRSFNGNITKSYVINQKGHAEKTD